MSAFCRISCNPSQQVEEENGRLFGISTKSPYLCIRFLIHICISFRFELVVSCLLFHLGLKVSNEKSTGLAVIASPAFFISGW